MGAYNKENIISPFFLFFFFKILDNLLLKISINIVENRVKKCVVRKEIIYFQPSTFLSC